MFEINVESKLLAKSAFHFLISFCGECKFSLHHYQSHFSIKANCFNVLFRQIHNRSNAYSKLIDIFNIFVSFSCLLDLLVYSFRILWNSYYNNLFLKI